MGTVISKSVAVPTALGGVISWLPHYASEQLIPLTIAFPALTMLQSSRGGAAGVALAYYGVASFPVAQVSSGYFGHASPAVGVLLWISATMILAVPWTILWHPDSQQVLWRLPAALLVVALPPIGIMGWASPLTAGGALLPGLGWYGVLLIVLACTAIGARKWRAAAAIAVASLLANLSYEGPRILHASWVGVNTEFGGGVALDDPQVDFLVAETVQKTALDTKAGVVVFPELLVRRWGEGAELFWQPAFDEMRARGIAVLIGAASPRAGTPDEYRNTVIIRGAAEPIQFDQRIPVPLAMWKPWGGEDAVPLNQFGPATARIAGERAAILICYEQLLPWSYLSSLWQGPTVLVGMSNANWTKETVIPRNQEATLKAWGRLLGVPVVSATNH
jgi:apolipoprotein N-acyltransferase